MVVRGGSVAVKKRGVKGEQTELAWIPPPRPIVSARTSALFAGRWEEGSLRTPLILPILFARASTRSACNRTGVEMLWSKCVPTRIRLIGRSVPAAWRNI
jgi:hypothetical protein